MAGVRRRAPDPPRASVPGLRRHEAAAAPGPADVRGRDLRQAGHRRGSATSARSTCPGRPSPGVRSQSTPPSRRDSAASAIMSSRSPSPKRNQNSTTSTGPSGSVSRTARPAAASTLSRTASSQSSSHPTSRITSPGSIPRRVAVTVVASDMRSLLRSGTRRPGCRSASKQPGEPRRGRIPDSGSIAPPPPAGARQEGGQPVGEEARRALEGHRERGRQGAHDGLRVRAPALRVSVASARTASS